MEAARKPLTHYAHEAMLACHEIARRRAVGRPLGDRLAATDAAMARYRETLHEAYRAARERRIPARAFGASEKDKARIAAESGMLTALEYIRY